MAYPSTFQAPATVGGLTPGGQLGAQLSAITRRAVIPSVFVQIYQSHPLLSLLWANSQRAKGGVGQISIPTQGASFVSFSWGSFAGDFPMPKDVAALQNATFNLKIGMIPTLRAVTSDAAVVIKQAFAQSLYSNNYATPNALDSLVQAYDAGANVPAYGGITRAGNAWWQGQYLPNSAGISNRTGMAIALTRIATGAGGDAPDFAVMNPADWSAVLADFMGYEMYQSRPRSMYGKDDPVNAGFRALRVLDTPIFPDPFCPRGEMYAINSRYLSLFV